MDQVLQVAFSVCFGSGTKCCWGCLHLTKFPMLLEVFALDQIPHVARDVCFGPGSTCCLDYMLWTRFHMFLGMFVDQVPHVAGMFSWTRFCMLLGIFALDQVSHVAEDVFSGPG